MTDNEMYELLCKKAQNIKMHMSAADVAEIAQRFNEMRSGIVFRMNDEDVFPVMISAFRYALGRRSYMPSLVAQFIYENRDKLSQYQRQQFYREIYEWKGMFPGSLGDDCDERMWLRFAERIVEE